MQGVGRVFEFRSKNTPDEYNTWVFRIMRNIEKSQGQLLKLAVDEKFLSLKQWRVSHFFLLEMTKPD